MRKTIYFDSFCDYTVAVIAESGKITEFSFEKRDSGSIIGNVYKGRVESVLPGMHAAFVNCGLEKNCYLSADDFFPDKDKYETANLAEPEIRVPEVGDEIMVQVVKAPVGNKGAKVSAHLSFVGKTLIYMPDTPFIGVSRKIADAELRKNLAYSARRLISGCEGLVVRTAAPYARRNQIEEEYAYLRNTWGEIQSAFSKAAVGELLYTDAALPVRVLRDMLSADIDSIVVGSPKLAEMVSNIVRLYPPHNRRTVVLHDTGRDMLEELGLSKQILEIASNRVPLENGAHLVIEKTEALTSIDVNTGRFTGDDNLEQTVYYTNILAAREIARQVKLRNIGGIVVVDFIDMQSAAHKKALVEELERALKSDKAKCAVSPMSRFGLVEFTRKRIGASTLSYMVRPCARCGGAGYEMRPETVILKVRAKILSALADGAQGVRIEVNPEVFEILTGWHEMREDISERAHGIPVYAVANATLGGEQFCIKRAPFDIPNGAVKIT